MIMVVMDGGVIQWGKVECGADDVPCTLVSLGVSRGDRADDVAAVLEKITHDRLATLISTLLVCVTFTWEERVDERARMEDAVVDFFKGSACYRCSTVFLFNREGHYERVIPEHARGDGKEDLRAIIPEGILARLGYYRGSV